MATIAELIDQRTLSEDTNKVQAGRRVFRVLQAANEADALAAFYADASTQVFPGMPRMELDRADIQGRAGNTLFIVTATYSTADLAKFAYLDNPQQRDDPFFGWSYRKETIKIPFMFQQRLITRSGSQSATKEVFTVKTMEVRETRITRSLKVKFQGSTRALDIIAAQDRKLHSIRGALMLFQGADVQQDPADQTKFAITYNWEVDMGTRINASATTPVIVFGTAATGSPLAPGTQLRKGIVMGADLSPGDAYFSSGFIVVRPAFHVLDVVQGENEERPPRAVAILPYDEDAQGWRGLPGMVNL